MKFLFCFPAFGNVSIDGIVSNLFTIMNNWSTENPDIYEGSILPFAF